MVKTSDGLLLMETARANVYRGLADAYHQPSDALSLVVEKLAAALDRLDSDARHLAASLAQGGLDHEILQVDYTRLFIGPFVAPAPPYGSVYLEDNRRLMGDSTVDVQKHYRSLGLDMSPDFKEAPDHITVELEFMHLLINQEMEAIEHSDGQHLAENLRHQRNFLQNHIGAWVTAFTAKVVEHARTDYYRHLASVTRMFIAEDMGNLADPAIFLE